jgi:hypothetical protein
VANEWGAGVVASVGETVHPSAHQLQAPTHGHLTWGLWAAGLLQDAARPVINCVVCLEDIQSPWSTPCGHLFCKPCIVDTLQVRRGCIG